jgi:hypothetical protein
MPLSILPGDGGGEREVMRPLLQLSRLIDKFIKHLKSLMLEKRL